MMVSSETSGFPFQLMEIYENKRCSILFHLLVAGGRCATVTARPVSSAKACSSFFHKRFLTPLEPPPSEVMRSSVLPGYKAWPIVRHQRRIDSTANAAVS